MPKKANNFVWTAASLLCGVVLLGLGCAAPESLESGAPIPEPTSALRPEALRGQVPEESRIVDYVLRARLDAEQHRVEASVRVSWRNRTQLSVDQLPFHLYMNGFRAEDTAWMRTSRGHFRRATQQREGAWGYIDVHDVRLVGQRFVASATEERAAPDAAQLAFFEHEDPSLMTVELLNPVGPGEAVTVEMSFTTQLPRAIARTGYGDSFHAVAQWFPKIGVLEEDGWQAHVFTLNDEFYADFGNYRLELDVAAGQRVGATGIRVSDQPLEDGRRRLVYEAEMVHDFVWMADPDFVESFSNYKDVRIRQLIQPDLAWSAQDHFDMVIANFESFEARFGPYPWSTLTIVHPPEDAAGAGGMEYPTLFTSSDRRKSPAWLDDLGFEERMSGVFTSLHEFGHQYFQGLIASREHQEPWLDEGLNTMSNMLAIEDRFPDPWLMRLGRQKFYGHQAIRFRLNRQTRELPVASPAAAFNEVPDAYSPTIYQKTGAVMLTLRNLVGSEAFQRAMRRYADEQRFRHPRGEDLERTLIEELGEKIDVGTSHEGEPVYLDLRHFLEQGLHTQRVVDFRARPISRQLRLGNSGWQRAVSGDLEEIEGSDDFFDPQYELLDDEEVEGVVRIVRSGDFQVPVDIDIELADGTMVRHTWSGQEGFTRLTFPGGWVKGVTIDPEGKLLLESHRLDNHRRLLSPGDGLSRPFADIVEAFAMLALGGVGP